jgi:(p)ppGpp synthase/HD superfamily hydrolase
MAVYSERYNTALVLAARAHRDQNRKGSDIPYIVHPVYVSVLLIQHGFPEDIAIAGLLHDVVEDQDVPLADIESGFGLRVAEMVAALTERKSDGDAARPWEVRKKEALDQLRRASSGAVAVKAADVLCNARAIALDLELQGSSIWRRFSRGPDQSIWYYNSVAEIVRERLGRHPLVDELEAAIAHLEQTVAGMEAG